MAIKILRPDQQATVIATLEAATEMSDSVGPNAALAKAAKQHGLPEKLLAYAVNAYNTGQSQANIKCGSTREEKAATVPLATLEGVMKEIYPDPPVKQSSVSSDYRTKPEFLLHVPEVKKSASRVRTEPVLPDDKVFIAFQDLSNAVKSARSLVKQEFYVYKSAQQDVQAYLDNPNHMRLSDLVDQSATAFGDLAKVVLEPLFDPHSDMKKSSSGMLVRTNNKPFSLVKKAIEQLERLFVLGQECGQSEEKLREQLKSAEHSECPRQRQYASVLSRDLFTQAPVKKAEPVNKQAFSMGEYLLNQPGKFLDTVKTAPTPKVTPAPTSPAAVKSDAKVEGQSKPSQLPGKILQPGNTAEIGSLNKSVALNSLMNSDSDLAGYDPNQITRAYNEIQSAFPNVASNPVTLRPFLQRHLTAGGLDDFTLKNLSDQERSLAQSQSPVK